MTRLYRISTGFLLSLFFLPNLAAQAASLIDGQNLRSNFMRVYSETLPPIGYIRFCRTFAEACVDNGSEPERLEPTEKRWEQLLSVNGLVNEMIAPVSDQELYGEEERWTFPTTKGDCEDYVLLKRRMLIEKGWPTSALLITVVTDENGGGHAVLTVRTSKGDFILDNRRPDVLVWNRIPYRFFKRQSYRSPNMWMSLMPAEGNDAVASAGASQTVVSAEEDKQ